VKAILGDICYPKSDAIIIPANAKGIMSRGVPERIIKDGLSSISKEAKQFAKDNKLKVGDCFSTGPGRLTRRGLKRIYHSVITRLQNDFTSIYIINEAIDNALSEVVQDKYESVSICGIGIGWGCGNLDPKTIARITVEKCSKYSDRVDIKIIDSNEEFIKEFNNFSKETL